MIVRDEMLKLGFQSDRNDPTYGNVFYDVGWHGWAPDDTYYEVRSYLSRVNCGKGKKASKFCIFISHPLTETEDDWQEYIWCQTILSSLNKLSEILKKKYPGTNWEEGWPDEK